MKPNEAKLCPRCHKGGFRVREGVTKPIFTCGFCDHEWSAGKSGGEYMAHAVAKEKFMTETDMLQANEYDWKTK